MITRTLVTGATGKVGQALIRHVLAAPPRSDSVERPLRHQRQLAAAAGLEHRNVPAFMLAVLDVPKKEEQGNDNHGSKVIALPFDGAALDCDLQKASAT